MKQAVIALSNLDPFLQAAREQYKVYAPVKQDAEAVLAELQADQHADLDYTNFTLSAKHIFFPRSEVLYTFKDDEVQEPPEMRDKMLVFGLRPCDARSFVCLDKVFLEFGGSEDPYYAQRRKNAVIVALNCATPDVGCFCTCTGGDPAGTEGADISAALLDGRLLFEAVSEKGEQLMDAFAQFFTPATDEDGKAREAVAEKARSMMDKIDIEELKAKLKGSFDSPIWDKLPEVCLGCGLCAYQCPTCHCFDIADEKKGSGGCRIRSWDSCQYSLFTMHASGHNPRTEKTQRLRQRILHKFLYTEENFDTVFCVGCGRCVRSCPVNLDIRETLKKLIETD